MPDEPVDLTVEGAAVKLPPPDHPFWDGPIKSASDGFPDLRMTREQMAARIFVLEARLSKLAATLGIDLDGQ